MKESVITSQNVLVGLMLITIILLAFSITRPVEIQIQSSPEPLRDTLSVSGTSELEKAPDQAIAYLSIITDDPDPSKAQQDNAQKSNAVMDAIKSWGAADKDIETATYSLEKRQEWNPNTYQYDEKGYRATHTLKVTTSRIDDMGSLVDAAVGAGANDIDHITFTLTKDSEKNARNEALQKAMELAKEKAQQLSATAGVTLDKVVTINEQSFIYRPYDYYRTAATAAAPEAASKISPSKVEIDATVNVVYVIK